MCALLPAFEGGFILDQHPLQLAVFAGSHLCMQVVQQALLCLYHLWAAERSTSGKHFQNTCEQSFQAARLLAQYTFHMCLCKNRWGLPVILGANPALAH